MQAIYLRSCIFFFSAQHTQPIDQTTIRIENDLSSKLLNRSPVHPAGKSHHATPAGENLHPTRLLSTLSSGRKATNKNAVVPTACHSYSFLSQDDLNGGWGFEGRCQNKPRIRRCCSAFPPRYRGWSCRIRRKRHGGRITCSIQPTLIPSPILLHTPTMRTLHIAQIYGVIQKQLVCLRAVSSSTGAFRF